MKDLFFLSIPELHAKLEKKDISCLELTEQFLERARIVDQQLHAFITLTPELALEQARLADQMFAAGNATELTGIPYVVKDNYCITGIRTTAGSKILENYIAPYTATAVLRLQTAGAVCLGKTNMDEFAMGSSTEYSAFGPTKNPYNLDKVPGGSSGGSAAAVASGACVFALGTETGGSIRQPAGFCGIVGLKPTYGRISRSGVIALASSLDVVAPCARSVSDISIILRWLSGSDSLDATTPDQPIEPSEELNNASLQGKKIGIPKEYMEADGLDPEVKRAMEEVMVKLTESGATLIPVSLPLTQHALAAYYVLVPSEASSNLARYTGVTYGLRVPGARTAKELIEHTRDAGFGVEPKRRIMLGTFALSAGYHEAYYDRAQKVRTLIRKEFEATFAQVDCILTPTSPTPPFGFGDKADPLAMYLADAFTIPVNLAGICALSLPGGQTRQGLPVGAQLIAPQFAEGRLFQIAHAAAQELKVEPPPLAV